MGNPLARAYLDQAKADFESYQLLKLSHHPPSQWLHFLQMAMEKTGKAYLAAYGRDWSQLRQSHLAFGRFIRILPRHRFIRQEIAGKSTKRLPSESKWR